ncbi:NAD-dependent epimerase/dehydratase family protein [Pelomonas aquatica]|uniref:NAD-dependent epimerase/dehydratase family protein n=1 Tax=Pelomonas aquatica TaxID=431058 RepID=A0A9X4LGY3_9BURK|nr:NAD-dependent epimerase/dehydratase family protein [Pelomonas aquatica]MCY4753147.1 NAD-dependent epimerase/dehydratase family protein [Pelomonas aquatica]MDG0862789.1 NAD-dependent epimerase/dehydratase family protein [Pelomonas aquatica]
MASSAPSPRILVTGGSGYVAGVLIRQLLAGGWQVNTSVRDLAREPELRQLLGVASGDDQLRCFAADLTADAGWAEAAAGCSHLAHVASPLPAGVPRDANELIVPARDGALRALKAARDAGVRRVVMTSSVAAIAYGHGPGEHHLTEADWTNLGAPGIPPYVQSKAVAERAARDWVAREGGGLEFCTVNPSVVLGPVASADYSASVLIVRRLLEGRLPALPNIGFGIVDVRDVAELHWRALTAPQRMADERFIACGGFLWLREIAAILRAELGDQARKVPTLALPDWSVRLLARFSPTVRAAASELGTARHQDSSHARERLGWVPRAPREAIVATARDLMALGSVTR